MSARVPQDVDLEDRIIFGLTAARFGELGLAALGGLAAWRLLPVAGGVIAVFAVAAGAALAWGRWRGRGADHWLLAGTRYMVRTRRIEVDRIHLPRRSAAPRAGTRARPRLTVLEGPLE